MLGNKSLLHLIGSWDKYLFELAAKSGLGVIGIFSIIRRLPSKPNALASLKSFAGMNSGVQIFANDQKYFLEYL